MRHVFLAFVLTGTVLASPGAWAAPLNVNTATQQELAGVDAIGDELAASIVREREENGSFSNIDDLKRVPGLGADVLGRIKQSGQVIAGITGKLGSGKGALGSRGDPMAAEVDRILKRFAGEPSIQQTQEAAVDYARANPGLIDSWRVRSRLRGLAPELDVAARVVPERDFRWNRGGTLAGTGATYDPAGDWIPVPADRNTQRFDSWENQLVLDSSARWRLDRLVFDQEETRVNREAVRLSKHLDQVLDDVTRRYFERRRLQVELELNPPTDVTDRLRKEIRLQELTADLDGMTGGWFSKSLKGKR